MLFRILLAFFAGLCLIHGENWAQPAVATTPAKATPDAAANLDFRFVRPDALAAFWFNVEEVSKNKSIRAWAEKNHLPQNFGLANRNSGFPVWQKVTQAYLLPADLSPQAMPSREVLFTFTAPDAQVMEQAMAKEEEERTKSFRLSDRQAPERIKFRVPELEQELSGIERGSNGKLSDSWRTQQVSLEFDARTKVIAGRGELLLQTLKPATPPVPAGWNKLLPIQNLNQSTLVGVIDIAAYRKLNPMQRLNLVNWRGYSGDVYSGLHLLHEKLDQLVIGVNLRDGLQLTAVSSSADEAQAKELKQLLDTEIARIHLAAPGFLQLLARVPTNDPALAAQLVKEVEQGINSIQVVQKNNLVRLTVQFRQQLFDTLVALQEQQTKQLEVANNLRQLAMGVLQQVEATKRFPATSFVNPANPQNASSWRVQLLPYLGEQELFKQYNFNEPWDSEQNKKLLDKMPAVYRAPNATYSRTSSSYYVLVHPGALFEAPKNNQSRPNAPRSVPDGTSNTLMLVEANAEIPWTKPEDLVFADPPAMPELGFGTSETFLAAMADGTIRQFPKKLPTELFVKLLLRNDGGALPNHWKSEYPELVTQNSGYPTLGWQIPRGPDTATKAASRAQSEKSPPSSAVKDRPAPAKENAPARQAPDIKDALRRAEEGFKKIEEENKKASEPARKAGP